MRLGEQRPTQLATIPSGCLTLDLALGGGWARGRVVEVYGPEASGKTTLALHAVAEAQRAGGQAVFVDAEHAFNVHFARRLGVDVDVSLFFGGGECRGAAAWCCWHRLALGPPCGSG